MASHHGNDLLKARITRRAFPLSDIFSKRLKRSIAILSSTFGYYHYQIMLEREGEIERESESEREREMKHNLKIVCVSS